MDSVYCAIYTRKSTSEGLDAEFTSLDNQREAALNYIASQRGQGWAAIPQTYDDGGFTGANMERPALQQLLDDIKAGGINCVVVYKVDRLSRSLTDFARLLEFFETHKVTFVSVTQHFNTQNSMGRLTLNILLSFAQFEREIISERTKDKMAAARKKGRWLGGNPPLGYDVNKEAKALVVNTAEAKLVREIFELYLDKRGLVDVANALNKRGLRTKRHTFKSGRGLGGDLFRKNDVAYILNNYLYIGKVKYAGVIYQGIQKAIVSQELFDRVGRLLAQNRVRRNRIGSIEGPGPLLRHILWCGHCKTRMTPTYSSKKNMKYRYYVCHRAHSNGYAACPGRSVNAPVIEGAVIDRLSWLASHEPAFKDKNLVINTPTWDLLLSPERRRVLNLLLKSVTYEGAAKRLSLEINEEGIEELGRELADALRVPSRP